MKSEGFASGLGARVHVRTTRVDTFKGSYSYISNAAIMIGQDILEVSSDGDLLINSHTIDKDDTFFAGYLLTRLHKGTKKRIVVYSLDLLGGKLIKIHANLFAGMIFINISGTFVDSEGLLGAPRHKGKSLFSRDGADLSGYWNTFAEDWQVRMGEPKLFRDRNRAPQHPDSCVYHQSKKLRRRLGMEDDRIISEDDAAAACDKVETNEMRDFCIFDVLARGDADLALDPFYLGN